MQQWLIHHDGVILGEEVLGHFGPGRAVAPRPIEPVVPAVAAPPFGADLMIAFDDVEVEGLSTRGAAVCDDWRVVA